MLIDCHTHDTTRTDAIISVSPALFRQTDRRQHRKATADVVRHHEGFVALIVRELLERAAAHPSVAAIGETGVDRLRGAGIDTQTDVFRRHIALSESLRKPLILHVVKALDIILAVKKECRPAMPWIWHGFRGNATMAKQLADNGILLSLGSHFNTDAAASIPADKLLVETDESTADINETAARIAACRHISLPEVIALASENLQRAVAYTV